MNVKVCYLVVKNNKLLEIDQKKIVTTVLAIVITAKSKPESIVNMAMMPPVPRITKKTLTHVIIQVKYPLSYYSNMMTRKISYGNKLVKDY